MSRYKLLTIVVIFGSLILNGFGAAVPDQAEALGTIDDLEMPSFLINQDSFINKVSRGTGEAKQIVHYQVKSGDTLEHLAQQYNVNANTIKWSNDLSSNKLTVGQYIDIYNIDGLLTTVKRGETVASLARRYAANDEIIAWYNSLDDGGTIHAGDTLFIPGGVPPSEVARDRGVVESGRGGGFRAAGPSISPIGSGILHWPLKGFVFIRGFMGHDHDTTGHHTGVDLAAPKGTPIYAGCTGNVVKVSVGTYGGGYGNHEIIDCGDGLMTLYGHQSAVSTQVGQHVNAGDVIGYVGSTGHSSGPHVHYEVLKGGVKVNPMLYLGPRP